MRDKLEANKDSSLTRLPGGISGYIRLFVGLFLAYLIFSPFVSHDSADGNALVRMTMAALLLILLITALVITFRYGMTAGKLLFFIFLAGLILRFGYMLYTPFYIRGHDIGDAFGNGHFAYMFRLYSGKGLPASSSGQFYHPPLEHLAGALIAKIYAFLTGEKNLETIFESVKLIPCFSSCALIFICSRLFDELHFSSRAKITALAVIAFHPTFIILAASINNDMLMIFLFMTAFLYTIRWYKDPTYKNILLLALSIGCAMSTKFSGALAAFVTAFIFLIVLLRKLRENNAAGILYQFAAFAAICFPLGLWYHLRNLKLFGQALGYIAQIPISSSLYIGDIPIARRFFTFSLPDMLKNVYCYPFEDFRIWEYTVKCALFGEFTFSEKHHAFAVILIITSLILIILSLAAMLWFVFFDKKKNRLAVLSLAALWFLQMLSFVFFNIKYPFGCTMDFRYIVPTVITGAAFLGLLTDKLVGGRSGKAAFICFAVLLGIFCLSSACFYII